MNIAIISPIRVELRAILAQIPHWEEEVIGDSRYFRARFEGKHSSFQIIAQQTGSKNEAVALAAERMVNRFRPSVVILAGVAGGVKDVKIGDVVVAHRYHGFDGGKVTDAGFAARPVSGHYSPELNTLAQSVTDQGRWKLRSGKAAHSEVVSGIISSSNVVLASTDSEIFRRLKSHYNDTTAIEMEAAGFGQTMMAYPEIRTINIRGISDLLDGKTHADSSGSQEVASENMAAFVFELLYQLDISNFKTTNMGVKELAKEVVGLLLPIIKLEAAQEIGHDLKEATNGTVRELWEKAKPLFIEEYGTLLNDPADGEAQADARSELRRALKKDPPLREEIRQLVEEIKKDGQAAGTVISHSKNVVQGNSITVGGNFSVGDKRMNGK